MGIRPAVSFQINAVEKEGGMLLKLIVRGSKTVVVAASEENIGQVQSGNARIMENREERVALT